MKRTRAWCFTLNNPQEDEYPELGPLMTYLVYQLEVGAEETPHLQGYIYYKQIKSLSHVNKLLPRAHIEAARSNPKTNRTYCTKEPRLDGPFEYGELPIQGERTDITALYTSILAGKRKRELFEEYPTTMSRYHRMYDEIHLYCMKPLRKLREVILLIGPPGSGKTSFVHTLWENTIFFDQGSQTSGGLWFDGYDQHERVLIDDFAGRASHTTLTTLLRMLDDYPVKLQIKGSFVWFNPDCVYITTNIHPKD